MIGRRPLRGLFLWVSLILGFRFASPQALRCRLLRRLIELELLRALDRTPKKDAARFHERRQFILPGSQSSRV